MPRSPYPGNTLCAVYHYETDVLVIPEKSRYAPGHKAAMVTGGPMVNALTGWPVEVHRPPQFIEYMTLEEAVRIYHATDIETAEEDEPWKS
jgi:hypothetical protein